MLRAWAQRSSTRGVADTLGQVLRPMGWPRRRLTIVADARFPGGTSAAVAAEICALAPHVDLDVVGIETAMFRGNEVNSSLQDALDDCGIRLRWNPRVVRADTVVVHNPACLKFDVVVAPRFSCAEAIVVTHENFLRPGGAEGFDVAHCLSLLDQALVCRSRWLAPVSPVNRRIVAEWLSAHPSDWDIAPFDWQGVCDMEFRPPTRHPRDRRGRHSRPGLEKFPPVETMVRHFPPHAERNVILGGDRYIADPETPRHWDVRLFGQTEVRRFLGEIDFFVYFTHPLWRESFGRAVAEAIAAGKVVIADRATAETFGPAVVASDGDDVDAIVAAFVADPERYIEFVAEAQDWLGGAGARARLGAPSGRAGPTSRDRPCFAVTHAGPSRGTSRISRRSWASSPRSASMRGFTYRRSRTASAATCSSTWRRTWWTASRRRTIGSSFWRLTVSATSGLSRCGGLPRSRWGASRSAHSRPGRRP